MRAVNVKCAAGGAITVRVRPGSGVQRSAITVRVRPGSGLQRDCHVSVVVVVVVVILLLVFELVEVAFVQAHTASSWAGMWMP
jgi:hypothetical protein